MIEGEKCQMSTAYYQIFMIRYFNAPIGESKAQKNLILEFGS